jgi:predicted anti-sigma-YlaC factor YlaD
MKKTNEGFSTQCDEVEHLLVKKDVDGLTPDEDLRLENHLRLCERCRSYQSALLDLRNSVQIDSEEKLMPDPSIRQNIVQRMSALKQKETSILSSPWQFAAKILAYRIPVYQTLAGVVLIFLVSFGINQLFLTIERESLKQPSFAQVETVGATQIRVTESLQIIDQQKIGRSAKEDVALTRFLVTAR